MTTKIAYQKIELPEPGARVFAGAKKTTSVEAVNGVTIDLVIDGPLRYFAIAGPTVIAGTEVPWEGTLNTVRKPVPPVRGKGGKAEE